MDNQEISDQKEKYPKTYGELFYHIKSSIKSSNSFLKWLGIPWKSVNESGNDSRANKMEACFRLFAILGMHPFQKKYQLCIGNFNTGQTRICNDSDIQNFLSSSIKDSGDKSDVTFQYISTSDTDKNEILTITCKDWKNNHVGNFDIAELQRSGNEYKNNIHYIGFCVRNKDKLYEVMNNSHFSSIHDMKVIKKAFSDDLVFDYDYLTSLFPFLPNELPSHVTNTFIPYFHQELCFQKIQERLQVSNSVILNALPRSGKTQIIGLCIQRLDSIIQNDTTHNVLLMTLRPSENFKAYRDFLTRYIQGYNIVFLNETKDKEPTTKEKTIYVCSKQFLQTKTEITRKIEWLEKKKISIVFIDEPHDGGSTQLATDVYNTYCKNTKTVFVTATCSKPAIRYNIPKENVIKWDLEDVNLCRDLTDKNRLELESKHGKENIELCLKKFSNKTIQNTYKRYPEMILTTCNFYLDIKKEIISSGSGWSINALFMMDKNEDFCEHEQVVKFFQSIFGNHPRDSRITKQQDCCIERWKKTMIEKSNRVGNTDPSVIMMFIDRAKITSLGKAIKKVLDNQILCLTNGKCEYEVIVLNTEENKGCNSIKRIYDSLSKCKNTGQKGIIVITGQMCSAAASIPECDVVMLLHDGHSWDNYFQQVFRPITEDKGKTCGIVCDFNNRRSLNFIAVLAENIYGKSDVSSIEKILTQNIIKITDTDWYNIDKKIFEQKNQGNYIKLLAQNIHKNWLEDVGATRVIIQTLSTQAIISKDSVKKYNMYFNNVKSKKNQVERQLIFLDDISDELQGKDRDIDSGISESRKKSDNSDNSDNDKKLTDRGKISINMFQEVFQYIVVLLVIMTIDEKDISEFDKMCEIVDKNDKKKEITITLLRSIWGTKIPDDILNVLNETYKKELSTNANLKYSITYLKERFIAVRKNPRKLYELIEEFLIPHEIERRNNAEISTPQLLRKDMLDRLPKSLWTKKVTVFEPCCGKGGFLIDIVDRFMSGLVDKIPNEEKRLKFILEKMLYFADINPLNIYICETILNPNGKYKLNSYTGDTLKLDIKEVWGRNSFTAVIGNPPYNSGGVKSYTGKLLSNVTKNQTIWPHFVEYALDILKDNGYLCYVTPLSWLRKSHKLHSILLSKTVLWLELWDDSYTKKKMSADIPISSYVICNKNFNNSKSIIVSKMLRTNIYTNCITELQPCLSIPLAYPSIFNKLYKYIQTNNCKLTVKKIMCKTIGDSFLLPEKYSNSDNFAVDTFRVKDGLFVKKMTSVHIDQSKCKLIIPNKSSFKGCFIDNGRLGLCGTDKFYILGDGDQLEKLKILLESNLCNFLVKFMKYRQHFLDEAVFDYIPDVRHIEYDSIEKLYKKFNLSDKDIRIINTI